MSSKHFWSISTRSLNFDANFIPFLGSVHILVVVLDASAYSKEDELLARDTDGCSCLADPRLHPDPHHDRVSPRVDVLGQDLELAGEHSHVSELLLLLTNQLGLILSEPLHTEDSL